MQMHQHKQAPLSPFLGHYYDYYCYYRVNSCDALGGCCCIFHRITLPVYSCLIFFLLLFSLLPSLYFFPLDTSIHYYYHHYYYKSTFPPTTAALSSRFTFGMTQSPKLRSFFRFNRHQHQQTSTNKTTATAVSSSTMNGLGSPTQDHVEEDNVQGWLMSVPGYRQQHASTLVDADNNRFEGGLLSLNVYLI